MKKLFSFLIVFTCFVYASAQQADTLVLESEPNSANNIIIFVKYKTQKDKGNITVSELTKLIGKVEQEPHFVSIKLLVDPTDNTNILLYEEWSDEFYYKSDHMNTEHLMKFIANSRNFLAGPPEISIWKVEREFAK